MKVLIVGGGGYLGRIVGPALEAIHEVSYLDFYPIAGAEGRTFIGNVSDEKLVSQALQGQQAVIYMVMGKLLGPTAEQAEFVNQVDPTFNANVRDQFRLLKMGLEMGIRRFVTAGSLSIYAPMTWRDCKIDETTPPDAFDPYGMSKRLAEQLYLSAAQSYADSVLMVLRLNLPANQADFDKKAYFHYDRAKGRRNMCALAPQDTSRLMVAALAYDKPGCHIVQATGDLEGLRFPNHRVKALLGWEPQGV